MKQHVTIKQVDELSEKAKDTLQKLLDPVQVFLASHSQWYFNRNDKVYPLPNIGQMIEFMDEHTNNDWDMNIGNTPMVIQCSELCDVLWEAVKKVLET